MSAEQIIYFIVLAFIAEVIGTVGGFGSSMFFVPLASFFLDFHSVLGITAVFHVTSNLSKIALFRQGFDKKLLIHIGIPATLAVIAGAYFSKYLNTTYLELGLAIVLIILSITLLIFRNLKIAPNLRNSIAGGLLSGGIAGLLGTGGAIRGIVLAAFQLKTQVFIATSAMIDLGVDASRTIVYYLNGYIRKEDYLLIALLLIVSFAGTYVGKVILRYVSEYQFRSLVLILIFCVGVITLLRFIT
jgi:uncharacterized membrane protein YfcA